MERTLWGMILITSLAGVGRASAQAPDDTAAIRAALTHGPHPLSPLPQGSLKEEV